ncbi:hypothetical protein GCM10019016_032660 [Streptomyces prasinosporus]|uniref:Uncharacterized protein n=1 Tax=Streptomyces prasinosporus TaxID=68256 RepID=A0ABP6TLN3_9ACTN
MVAVLAATVDVRVRCGFSSFGVLTYYVRGERLGVDTASGGSWPRLCARGGVRRVPGAGVSLPWDLVAVARQVLGAGVAAYGWRKRGAAAGRSGSGGR